MDMHWPWIKLFWRNNMFDNFGYYMSSSMKDWKAIKSMEATYPKQYGQSLQQKKRGNGKRKKRVKGK